jgi:hypothetical protein
MITVHAARLAQPKPGVEGDACQRMKSANGFLMENFTSVGTFYPLAKKAAILHRSGGNSFHWMATIKTPLDALCAIRTTEFGLI